MKDRCVTATYSDGLVHASDDDLVPYCGKGVTYSLAPQHEDKMCTQCVPLLFDAMIGVALTASQVKALADKFERETH